MAVVDVKITDLEQVESLRTDDLFLIANPNFEIDGTPMVSNPYTSNSISGGALSSSIRESLRRGDLIIEGHWHFHGGPNNVPTQDTKLEIDDFLSALETKSKLSSIIHDSDPGWYRDSLSSSVMQNPANVSGDEQSLSIPNNSIPNIDFVERAIAGAYQSLLNQLTTIVNGQFIPSRIGQIVISTVFSSSSRTGSQLSAPSNDNIRKFYGYGQNINGVQYPDTTWIRHEGYFLRGGWTTGNHNVISGNAGKPDDNGEWQNHAGGGNDSVKMTSNMLIEHSHKLSTSTSKITATFNKPSVTATVPGNSFGGPKHGNGAGTSGGTSATYNGTVTTPVACTVNVSGGSVTVSFNEGGKTNDTGKNSDAITPIPTIPKYKNVYIWERIA